MDKESDVVSTNGNSAYILSVKEEVLDLLNATYALLLCKTLQCKDLKGEIKL
jgi:hypothetical protein